ASFDFSGFAGNRDNMFRRYQSRALRGSSSSKRKKQGRSLRSLFWRRSTIERLEDRWMLSITAPALHSDPGAAKAIFLDFDGHLIRNTLWNVNGFGNIINAPYDTDGDLTTFSPSELDTIQMVWQRVSEDFSPFDVDVTTVDPGVDALTNTGGGDTNFGLR